MEGIVLFENDLALVEASLPPRGYQPCQGSLTPRAPSVLVFGLAQKPIWVYPPSSASSCQLAISNSRHFRFSLKGARKIFTDKMIEVCFNFENNHQLKFVRVTFESAQKSSATINFDCAMIFPISQILDLINGLQNITVLAGACLGFTLLLLANLLHCTQLLLYPDVLSSIHACKGLLKNLHFIRTSQLGTPLDLPLLGFFVAKLLVPLLPVLCQALSAAPVLGVAPVAPVAWMFKYI